MIYNVTRTSDLIGSSKKPCANAFIRNIGEKYGEITWAIIINTLEELQALQKEVKHPLIVDDDTIEIYDDYRE